jgi:hypothetical protein
MFSDDDYDILKNHVFFREYDPQIILINNRFNELHKMRITLDDYLKSLHPQMKYTVIVDDTVYVHCFEPIDIEQVIAHMTEYSNRFDTGRIMSFKFIKQRKGEDKEGFIVYVLKWIQEQDGPPIIPGPIRPVRDV